MIRKMTEIQYQINLILSDVNDIDEINRFIDKFTNNWSTVEKDRRPLID